MTIDGPVYPLLALRLIDLTPEAVESWAAKQAKVRPTYGRLAWRCIKVFLGWCMEQAEYRESVSYTHLVQGVASSNPATPTNIDKG